MHRQRRLYAIALYAAIIALLAAALVPASMQMAHPVAIAVEDMPGCDDAAMQQMHHAAPSSDPAGQAGNAESCLMCSLVGHIPTLPALLLPPSGIAPLALVLILQLVWRSFLLHERLIIPPVRGPPNLDSLPL